MSWSDTLNARGWKLPFVGKSLFQIGKELRPKVDALIMRRSLVPGDALIDKHHFPWIAELERHWREIRDEALGIRAQDIPSLGDLSFDHGRIAKDRRWRSLFLRGYGYRMNAARAPITAALIAKVPGLVTASFSVLEAGGHIPRHWGMTKGMLTYHLALRVPNERDKCRMTLEGPDQLHVLSWEEGQSFVFDDMFNHEVWNETDEDRYLLLIQIRRPCWGVASLIQDAFLFGVRHSRFVQDIRRNIDAGGQRMPDGGAQGPDARSISERDRLGGMMQAHIRRFLSERSPLDDRTSVGSDLPCKICDGIAKPFCGVDFNKSCNNYPLTKSLILIEYYRCSTCDLLFTDFFDDWSSEEFSTFLYNDDYIKVDPDYAGERSTANAHLLKDVLAPGKGTISILDYGSGRGGLAAEMLKHGFARVASYDPYAAPAPPLDGPFDVVTAFEVVEHSTRPAQTLDELVAYMKPDGCVIVGQTMQPENLKEIRSDWWYIAPRNGHVTFYSHRTIQRYAESRDLIYRNVGGWFVLHGPAPSPIVREIVRAMPRELSMIRLFAPPAEEIPHGAWHNVEEIDGQPFRWSRQSEISFGSIHFESRKVLIEVPYLMMIQTDFVRGCRLRVGDRLLELSHDDGMLAATFDGDQAEYQSVSLITPPPIAPSTLGVNDDGRSLGIAIPCASLTL